LGNRVKAKKKPGYYLSILLFMALGGLAGMLAAPLLREVLTQAGNPGQTMLRIACLLLLLALAVWLQIVIHEAGHLVFGIMTGYRFSSFRVGSLNFIKTGEHIQLKRMSLAGTAGQCLLAPPEDRENFPVMPYLLGGVILNLLVSLLCLGGYFLLSGVALLRFFLLCMGLVGILYAVLNGVPSRMNMVDNDGYNALLLRKNPQAKRALWIALQMNARLSQGESLADMPEEWFDLPDEAQMGSSLVASLAVFRANWLMDRMAFEEADRLMACLLSRSGVSLPGIYRHVLLSDRAYCALMGAGSSQVLDTYRGQAHQKAIKLLWSQLGILRTEYAYALLASRDPQAANAALEEFDKQAAQHPYAGDVRSERKLLQLAAERAAAQA